jgi:hypothetical protein
VNLTSEGFFDDASTRFSVQCHADGLQTLVLITTRQIDATGRPNR